MSSRLFNEVREKKGLAYEIGTQIKRFADTGAFLVHAGIDNRKVPQAVQVILRELRKIRSGLISEDEFRRAKDFYVGQLELSMEDTMDNMLWIGESTTLLDKTHTLEEVIRHIRALTREDVRKAASQIFIEKSLNVAAIGPLKGQEACLRDLLHL
jgi:predicted Zn-dependent peptidase